MTAILAASESHQTGLSSDDLFYPSAQSLANVPSKAGALTESQHWDASKKLHSLYNKGRANVQSLANLKDSKEIFKQDAATASYGRASYQ